MKNKILDKVKKIENWKIIKNEKNKKFRYKSWFEYKGEFEVEYYDKEKDKWYSTPGIITDDWGKLALAEFGACEHPRYKELEAVVSVLEELEKKGWKL